MAIIYNGTYCVYAHINKINGKIYIGQTKHGDNPNRRWENGGAYKHSQHFYSAIQKYGWDNFEHEIIARHLTLDEANKFESLLIQKLDSTNPLKGYNIESGGKNSAMSDETRQKISRAHKGKKKSPEAIAKSREARKGLKLREETKQKIGLSHKGAKHWNAKSVNQYDLKTGELIKQWEYIYQIEEELGYSNSEISSCCKGKLKSAKGYLWTYADVTQDEVNKRLTDKSIQKKPSTKIICQYSKDGTFIKEWANCVLAERELGISNIGACCKGEYHTSGGYIWLYENDVSEEVIFERVKKANGGSNRKNLRKVNQYNKDETFVKRWDSMANAARAVNDSSQHIYECCNGKRKTAGGYIWKYAE